MLVQLVVAVSAFRAGAGAGAERTRSAVRAGTGAERAGSAVRAGRAGRTWRAWLVCC